VLYKIESATAINRITLLSPHVLEKSGHKTSTSVDTYHQSSPVVRPLSRTVRQPGHLCSKRRVGEAVLPESSSSHECTVDIKNEINSP